MPANYWLFWLVFPALAALLGSCVHSLFLIGYNMICVGVYIYLYNRACALGN